jgi:preprotein translocase subunit YajC
VQNGGQLLLLLVLIAFTVWVFSRGRRQQREMQATQARLRAGAEVMTTSGLHAKVVELTDDGLVRLETSPGVVSRWDRRAVARVLSAPDAEPAVEEPALEDEPVEPPAVEPAGAEPADPRPVDVIDAEPVRHSDPVLPVEPGRPEAGEPVRPAAAEPPGPVPSPKDGAPPDRA